MPQIGQAGRIRLSPLQQAVASSKAASMSPTTTASTDDVGGVVDQENGEMLHTGELPEGITPEQVQAAKQAAAQGDPAAIDWLKMLGIGAGVAGAGIAGTALYKSLKNRKQKGKTGDIPVEPKTSASSRAMTVRAPEAPQIENIPVTQLRDEQIIYPVQAPKKAEALKNVLKSIRRIR